MTSQANGSPQYGSERPDRALSLPSFTPLRDGSRVSIAGESSRSASRRSGSRRSGSRSRSSGVDQDRSITRDSLSLSSTTGDGNLHGGSGTISRRRRNTGSGGFLLDSIPPAVRPSRALLSHPRKKAPDPKGKRKSEESDLHVPKRRLKVLDRDHRASIGSSPLATEVIHDADRQGSPEDDGNVAHTKPGPSGLRVSGNMEMSGSLDGSSGGAVRDAPSSIGFNTDPAQIVNMALSLSEGRRRQASGMRLVSSDLGGSQRGGPSQLGAAPRGSIAQYFTPQRQMSRNISPNARNASVVVNRKVSVLQPKRGTATSTAEGEDEDMEMEMEMELSRATAARVEKAKTYLELAYEHRRLLSHLPPVRRPGTQVVSASAGQSKGYNPLQYVRNRKLRLREKSALVAEDEGWHDVELVRAWVDAVISSHVETRHDPNECVRLPELDHHKPIVIEEEKDPMEEEEEGENSPAPSLRRQSTAVPHLSRRPKSDWVTHPGDLIADAFWLEQGLNKTKIKDGFGNAIYPPDTPFKFSGWRNRTPVSLPMDFKPPVTPPEETPQEPPSPPPSALPELPKFASSRNTNKRAERTRRIDRIRNSISGAPRHSRDLNSRKSIGVVRSHLDDNFGWSDSSSDDSSFRGRKKISRKRQKKKAFDDDSSIQGGQHTASTMDDQEDYFANSRNHNHSGSSSKRTSTEHSRISRFFTRDSARTLSGRDRSHGGSDSARGSMIGPLHVRSSLDEGRMVRTSGEYDTTAPSSPAINGIPSIAINLSPPASRSPSPSKKAIPSMRNPFRNHSKQREGISETDFASKPASDRNSRNGSLADSGSIPSRGTSPMTRGTSPMTKAKKDSVASLDQQPAWTENRANTVSRVSTKSSVPATESSSKIRGRFKGGRIAELVGHEVSRVGDYIWKRDAPAPYHPRMSTSTSSLPSQHGSDTDEELRMDSPAVKTPSPQHHTRYPSSGQGSENRSSPTLTKSTPSSGEKPYHNSNLPSFTSPFQKDRELQEDKKRTLPTPGTSPPQLQASDHITRLAAEHRSSSKSLRLDRLAPPKLDTSGPPSPSLSTVDGPNDASAGNRIDGTRSRNASEIFNRAIQGQPNGVPVTGLSGLKASRSGVSLNRNWNRSAQSLARLNGGPVQPEQSSKGVTTRDIGQVYAFLLSSAVKAREISLRAEAVRDPAPRFLLESIDASSDTLHTPEPLRVARRNEHVVAARNLIGGLTANATRFHDRLTDFSRRAIPELQTGLQALEDMVEGSGGGAHHHSPSSSLVARGVSGSSDDAADAEYSPLKMVPRVQRLGDESAELSLRLATTSTLAVKALNDSIDAALRRHRRGPAVRWLRKAGYQLIEWAVVGLLWAIWAVVMILRVAAVLIRAGAWLVWAVRWLFWLA